MLRVDIDDDENVYGDLGQDPEYVYPSLEDADQDVLLPKDLQVNNKKENNIIPDP